MMGKKTKLRCSNCGKGGHTQDKCWACKVCGKTGHRFPNKEQRQTGDIKGKGKYVPSRNLQGKTFKKWYRAKEKASANLCSQSEKGGIIGEQLEHLLKMLPVPSKVTRTGNSRLKCGINLKGVVYTPMFNHNLISVHKLTEEEDCRVVFTSVYCMILDKQTSNVKGIGKIERGVYKLINEPINEKDGSLNSGEKLSGNSKLNIPAVVNKGKQKQNITTTWHHRLGHAPVERIIRTPHIKGVDITKAQQYLI
ncbi:Gag-Pol polyprotein [Bienertia sinuspersici]